MLFEFVYEIFVYYIFWRFQLVCYERYLIFLKIIVQFVLGIYIKINKYILFI